MLAITFTLALERMCGVLAALPVSNPQLYSALDLPFPLVLASTPLAAAANIPCPGRVEQNAMKGGELGWDGRGGQSLSREKESSQAWL